MPQRFVPTVVASPGYTFIRLNMDLEAQTVHVAARAPSGEAIVHEWHGAEALALLSGWNSGDYRAASLVEGVFMKLVAVGRMPAGTVVGVPT